MPPDVVIVGGNDSRTAAGARALLTRWPRTSVLMISARGHQVLLHQLLPRSTELGELSRRADSGDPICRSSRR